jgi:hypothetical protein
MVADGSPLEAGGGMDGVDTRAALSAGVDVTLYPAKAQGS